MKTEAKAISQTLFQLVVYFCSITRKKETQKVQLLMHSHNMKEI